MKLIDKDKVVAEIKKLQDNCLFDICACNMCGDILSFLDALEVKEVDTWHLQEKEDIYDSFNDWSLHYFACLMKDGTIQKFTGILAECLDGSVNKHIDAVDEHYDDVEDILYWTEIPNIKVQKGE